MNYQLWIEIFSTKKKTMNRDNVSKCYIKLKMKAFINTRLSDLVGGKEKKEKGKDRRRCGVWAPQRHVVTMLLLAPPTFRPIFVGYNESSGNS